MKEEEHYKTPIVFSLLDRAPLSYSICSLIVIPVTLRTWKVWIFNEQCNHCLNNQEAWSYYHKLLIFTILFGEIGHTLHTVHALFKWNYQSTVLYYTEVQKCQLLIWTNVIGNLLASSSSCITLYTRMTNISGPCIGIDGLQPSICSGLIFKPPIFRSNDNAIWPYPVFSWS